MAIRQDSIFPAPFGPAGRGWPAMPRHCPPGSREPLRHAAPHRRSPAASLGAAAKIPLRPARLLAGLPPWRPLRVPSGFGAPQRLPDARGAADWCSGLVLAPPPGGTVAVTLTTGHRRPIAISTVKLQEFL
ncbi:hypothetical protein GCM10023081_09850 [Arthrobacter ginkgonis]|uniref:Uncharacterized protein n=1 Tax=Arthrobacter ginkgonis TaxID=1630594 RepID=A0ABP7C0C8_9MICC